MNLSKRAPWIAAAPLLLVVLLAVLLPFAWRSGGFLSDCLRGDECAVHDLVADGYYLKAVFNTIWISASSRCRSSSRWRGGGPLAGSVRPLAASS